MKRLVSQALEEDLGNGDITGGGLVGAPAIGRMVAEADIVVAGLEVAREVFSQVDPDVRFTPATHDGANAKPGDTLAELSGSGAALLAAERVALNFVQRMSGIASLTRAYVDSVSGNRAAIADTRKTTPGLRMLEKYAVRTGGGRNHRMGLADGILIKENHIALAGGMDKAVAAARALGSHGHRIEVETTTLDEVHQALDLGAEVIMLDNFDLAMMKEAVELIGGRAVIEASGGVNLDTVRPIAETGVDIISVGRLTHSAPAAEISMDICPA